MWHLPAPHLPEQLLLIVYPHLSGDKKKKERGKKSELEREEESSLSQFTQPRGGDIWNVLHINARVIAFFRRSSNLMDEKRGGGGGGGRRRQSVIGSGSKIVRNNLFSSPPLPLLLVLLLSFPPTLKKGESLKLFCPRRTSAQAAVAAEQMARLIGSQFNLTATATTATTKNWNN